ncbi:MAG TPA: hypothetical protein VLB72_06670 [Burkholderiales bacterium]|nr:hypothetical protein [Burkholderiales bacterium]
MKSYTLWFVLLILQAFLTFGLYMTWSTFQSIHDDSLSKALRETTRMESQTIAAGPARTVIDQQAFQIHSARSDQAELLEWTSWWFYLSLAIFAVQLSALLGVLFLGRRKQHESV